MKNDNYYETEKYIFFYGSFYSQWAIRDININNVVYNTCEQYMMAQKALLFNDHYALNQIMESKDPKVQKSWGRKVRNFKVKEWEEKAQHVVFIANYAKFTQHEDLKKRLLDTGDKILVEASPWDKIWGIGMRASDKGIEDPKNWKGTNWLGEAIMKVRAAIRIDIEEEEEF